jgi:hypothetical protein
MLKEYLGLLRLVINEERNLCREQIEIIKERQEELPQLVVEELTKRFRIDGVIPVTPEDIRKIIEEQLSLTSTNGPMKLIIEKLNILYAMENMSSSANGLQSTDSNNSSNME